jgi:predicted O-methyltransferase YrrM
MVDSYTIGAKYPLLADVEVDLIKECVRHLQPYPTIVNIGAGVGAGTMAMLEVRDDLVIFSVDIAFPTTGMYEPGERQNLIDAGYWESGSVIQVLGPSQIVGKKWNVPYDLIFIDGDHRYEYVKKDIELWLPMAKPGAYILFHDYAKKRRKPKAGVKQAVDELLGDYDFVGHERHTWAIMRPFT